MENLDKKEIKSLTTKTKEEEEEEKEKEEEEEEEFWDITTNQSFTITTDHNDDLHCCCE